MLTVVVRGRSEKNLSASSIEVLYLGLKGHANVLKKKEKKKTHAHKC